MRKYNLHVNLNDGRDQKTWNLIEDTVREDVQQSSNGYPPEEFKHGCDTVRIWQNYAVWWEKKQEWMSSEELEAYCEGLGKVMVTEPRQYWRKNKEVDRSGKPIEFDNWILWSVWEGNTNLLFAGLCKTWCTIRPTEKESGRDLDFRGAGRLEGGWE